MSLKVEAKNTFSRAVEDQGVLLAQPDDGFLGFLAPGNVPNDSAEEQAFLGMPGCQGEFDGKLLSCAREAHQLNRSADQFGCSTVSQAHDAGIVCRPESVRHQHGERMAQGFPLAVTEHPFGSPIPPNDVAVLISE